MRLFYSVKLIHSSDLTFVRLQHGMWTYAPSSCTFPGQLSISFANGSALPESPRSQRPSFVPRCPSSRSSSISFTTNARHLYPPPVRPTAAARSPARGAVGKVRKAGYGRRGPYRSRSFGATAVGVVLVLRKRKCSRLWLVYMCRRTGDRL